MKKLITLIILVTSTLVTAKEIEVIKFDNIQSPEINRNTLFNELDTIFDNFNESCTYVNKYDHYFGASKRYDWINSVLINSGAEFPKRFSIDRDRYAKFDGGRGYATPHSCLNFIVNKSNKPIDIVYKYYCNASSKGANPNSFFKTKSNVETIIDKFSTACGLKTNKSSLPYIDSRKWYNQWITGMNIFSEYMMIKANKKITETRAKQLARKKARKLKEEQLAKQKLIDADNARKLKIEQDKKLAAKKIIDDENARLRKIENEKQLALQKIENAKRAKQHKLELEKQRIAKENSIKDIKSGKSKLSTCDPTVFDSGYGIGLLYSPPINADNKSYVFHRMNIYNKYNDSQILYRYTNTDKMLLVNITPKTYIYQGEGYWQLTTCIIGTVTDIKHINGVTIAVINADYIGKSLDGY